MATGSPVTVNSTAPQKQLALYSPMAPPRRRSRASVGASIPPARFMSKRVADPREDGRSLAAVADIDIADHEGPRDPAKADPPDGVQLRDRPVVHPREDAADIGERRHLEIE